MTERIEESVAESVFEWLSESRYFRKILKEALKEELPRIYRRLPQLLEDVGALKARWVDERTLEVYFDPEEAPASAEDLRELIYDVVVDEACEQLHKRVIEKLRAMLRGRLER